VLLFFLSGDRRANLNESLQLSNGFLKPSLAMPVPTRKTGKNLRMPMNLSRENQANGPLRENFTHNA
jgi:hypothetical protein